MAKQPSLFDLVHRPRRIPPAPPGQVWLAVVVLGLAFIWCYWFTFVAMAHRWANEPQYSHGFLVPFFAAIILWVRWPLLRGIVWDPHWLGLFLMGAGLAIRTAAIDRDIAPLDAFSLLPTLAGLILLVGGWDFFKWSFPAVLFLSFMLPLPYAVEAWLAHPLRRIATTASHYMLVVLGVPAMAEGNIIFVEDIEMGVADACSGLGMLMTFFALATACAYLMEGNLFEKLVVVASAIPVALASNVARITATGVAYYAWGKDSPMARAIYHDLAGWLMMPLAMLMVWLVMKFLKNLWVEEASTTPMPILFAARSAGAK